VAKKLTYTEADAAFRHALYHFIVTRGHVPKIGELTAALSRSQKTVRSALQRLADLHILVLQQNTSEVLRAAPFWAVPTAFHVQSAKRSWWASCIWDALAIPLMLRRDARVTTRASKETPLYGQAPGK
jgi:Alkylmercury lyase